MPLDKKRQTTLAKTYG